MMSGMSQLPNGGVPGVGPGEASKLVGEGAVLVDVREDYEWEAGRAPMARHIPLAQLADEVDDLPADRQLVVVCRAGSRSARATAFLLQAGFDATNLEGGMNAWLAAGRPVEADDGSPGVVA
jgi:rhodanese-related sulfurtransferase